MGVESKKIALLFPGQGGQYSGMGKSLYEKYEKARNVFHRASDITGIDVADLCFNGKEDELKDTLNSQLGILTVSISAWEVLREHIRDFNLTAGLSLGEYGALYAAGVIGFEDVFSLVKKRALYMQDACNKTNGTMVSILGLNEQAVKEICGDIKGFCSIANLNCPGQVVVSCSKDIVNEVVNRAKEKGARRAIELKVAGAFHSEMMKEASDKFLNDLKNYSFNKENLGKVVLNILGDVYDNSEPFETLMAKQIISPVLWEKSVRKMIEKGCAFFIEVGPGKVLGGLLRRIDKNAAYSNVEDEESLNKTLKYLES